MAKSKTKVWELCCIAVLTALIVLMALTGIGYIPIGPLKLTLNTLPVAIGGAVLGKKAGLILGTVFGITSFMTCLGILFPLDAFGAILFGINPYLTFVMCVVPRMLCGFLPALLRDWLKKYDRHHVWTSALSCGLTAALNTLLFLGSLWLFFAQDLAGDPNLTNLLGGAVTSFVTVLVVFAGVNALVEIGVNLTLGTAISKALLHTVRRPE